MSCWVGGSKQLTFITSQFLWVRSPGMAELGPLLRGCPGLQSGCWPGLGLTWALTEGLPQACAVVGRLPSLADRQPQAPFPCGLLAGATVSFLPRGLLYGGSRRASEGGISRARESVCQPGGSWKQRPSTVQRSAGHKQDTGLPLERDDTGWAPGGQWASWGADHPKGCIRTFTCSPFREPGLLWKYQLDLWWIFFVLWMYHFLSHFLFILKFSFMWFTQACVTDLVFGDIDPVCSCF